MSPLVLGENTNSDWIAAEKGERETKYFPSRFQQTPPMPKPEAYTVPIHVGERDGDIASGWAC